MLFFSTVAMFLSALSVESDFDIYDDQVLAASQSPERNETIYPRDATFANYTIRVLELSTARVMLKAAWVNLILETTVTVIRYVTR